MITWKNLDTVSAYQELLKVAPVNLTEAMAGAPPWRSPAAPAGPNGAGRPCRCKASRSRRHPLSGNHAPGHVIRGDVHAI